MLGFSMVQLTRNFSHKFDKELRHQLVNLYKPFRRTPCFLHGTLEKFVKWHKKFPVIVEFDREVSSFDTAIKVMDQVVTRGSRSKIGSQFPSISSCSAVLNASTIEKLISDHPNIKRIYHDREVTAFLDNASPSIHAQQLNQQGITGEDVNIAIVDTGIYPHPDLTKPTNRIVGFKDFVNNRTDPYDDNGHGTHCAGDAASNGFSSDGQYKGPAPEANVIGVKVLNAMGSGSLSTVADGIQWCIDHREEHQIDVISLSLGAQADESNCQDPLVQIVEKAWESGIVVCVAAGNSGPDKRTIGTPGISSKVVTVGAIDDQNTTTRSDDQVASFSSRGPACGEESKPDLLTPGANIISLKAPGSFLAKMQKSAQVGDNYLTLSGTSMATPICAGIVALVLQNNSEYTPDQVKQHLLKGSVDRGLPPYVQGAGYLDAQTAVIAADNNSQ